MTIRPIPTWYRGERFNSTLEADWACTFDWFGWKWEYEPHGILIDDNTWYRPDFYLPTQRIWAEVKGPHNQRIDKPSKLQAALSRDSFEWDVDLVVVLRPPQPGKGGGGETCQWEDALSGQDIVMVLCPECGHHGFMDLAGTWSCRRHLRERPEPNKFWTEPEGGLFRSGELPFTRVKRVGGGPQRLGDFFNDYDPKGRP